MSSHSDRNPYATCVGSAHRSGAALAQILAAATLAADPGAQIRRVLQADARQIRVAGEVLQPRRVILLCVGKAAPAMAAAACAVLGGALSHGLVIYKDIDPALQRDPRLTYHPAGHPVPNERSSAAGVAARTLVATAHPADLVLVLLSGGGSALMVDLAAGISLHMLQDLTRLLLASGADINAINTVRRRIDTIKGGGLARAGAHTTLRTLILSDVIGNSLPAIASGPTVANPDDAEAALQVLRDSHIIDQVDSAILAICRSPMTIQPVAQATHIIADIGQSLAAAATTARALGYEPTLVSATLQGEAHEVGTSIAQTICALPPSAVPRCLLWGGETTVTLAANHGLGGRNQTVALALAQGIAAGPECLVATYATDGGDGPTDAAGAVVDHTTWARAAALGHDPHRHLTQNDAYPLFAALGDLLLPGPTGTNVNDVVVALVENYEL